MATDMKHEGEFDYIIVGAGTAGCVLANRLTADGRSTVLLIEAGGSDNYHWVHIPIGYLYCIGNPRTDWMMKTASEAGLNGRSLVYPRGKVLGGCSSINGMIYMRGQAADYDHWRQLGNVGWGWDDVLPYFKKSESHHGGANEFHGATGEWRVARQRLSWEILRAVQEGAREKGIEPRADFNDGNNEGSGFFEVNQSRGLRWNTTKGFLRPVLRRKNLRVVMHGHVAGITLDGRRVTGVSWQNGNKVFSARARREVLLAAGSINSPKLLEQSGIGSARILKGLGIEVRHELPGVGENLQDHLQIRTVYKVQNTRTLNEMTQTVWGQFKLASQYLLARNGPLSMAPSQFGMFTRSGPEQEFPDLEYHVQPLSTNRLGEPLHPFPAITVSVCNLRPTSVGHVHSKTRDPAIQPEIMLNYLSTERDRRIAVSSMRQARSIMTAKSLAPFKPQEWLPGLEFQSDAELLNKAGDIATTIFHPVGTCKMGNDPNAVVDAQLRVHGIDGMRVVDASIMPKITSGNTASPVVMIAEKAADMIRSDARQ
jgi:choline dehydrogenase